MCQIDPSKMIRIFFQYSTAFLILKQIVDSWSNKEMVYKNRLTIMYDRPYKVEVKEK